jgi:hypothetical protein
MAGGRASWSSNRYDIQLVRGSQGPVSPTLRSPYLQIWSRRLVTVNIKDRVEHNPFVYILVVTIAVSGTAIGITEYFCRQRIEITSQKSALEISALQTELTSIRRGLGDSKYVDIRTFVRTKDLLGTPPINPQSKFFECDDFYARTDLPGWTYERMTNEQFTEKFYGGKPTPLSRKLTGDLFAHVWYPSKTIHLEAELEKDYFFVSAGPLIVLERYPLKISEHLPEILQQQMGENVEITSEDIRNTRASLERLIRGDAAAGALQAILTDQLWTTQTTKIVSQIIELQKVGNVVYSQSLATVHSARVDKQPKSVFFVRTEMIFIMDRSTVTAISIIVPIDDPAPRGVIYSQIQEWLSGLVVVVK